MTHLQKLRFGTTAIALCMSFAMTAPARAADDPKVSADIMAAARAQWAAEIAGKSSVEQMASIADDYTEFNPGYPTRLDGKAMAVRLQDVEQPNTPLFGDMQNAKVQTYGDTAILTYNYAGVTKAKDGKIEPATAKSTRVYVRENGKWMLVHANFAPVRAATN